MPEYGIFQSIVEGDQAEAYKKKKEAESKESKAKEMSRLRNRANAHDSGRQADKDPKINKTRGYFGEPSGDWSKAKKDLSKDYSAASRAASAKKKKQYSDYGSGDDFDSDSYERDSHNAADAVYRHNRRHPDSKISECSIEFI